jgi:pimeloyl-ACP methyl ester carboxylesterase
MCNEKLWGEVLPYLHDSLEVVYLDIPQGKNFDELAEHYNNILGNDTVNLIGFSLGGYIATYFSMLYPKRIEKLFVISNSPTNLSTEELNQRSDILKYIETYGYKEMSRKKVANLLDGANQADRLIDFILEMGSDLGESEFVSQYQYTSQRSDLCLAMKQFSFDMHLYYSENDGLINSQWLNELANLNSKLSLISTSGSGHMLPLEKPRELANYINSWVEL